MKIYPSNDLLILMIIVSVALTVVLVINPFCLFILNMLVNYIFTLNICLNYGQLVALGILTMLLNIIIIG
jgi:hypothetical protein